MSSLVLLSFVFDGSLVAHSQISCSQIAQTSHVTSSSVQSFEHSYSAITAFQVRLSVYARAYSYIDCGNIKTVSHNNGVYSFAGDKRGWLYSSFTNLREPATGYHISHDWRPEFSLSSEASTFLCVVIFIS